MTNPTTIPSTNDESLALQFFEAILMRDTKALRQFGVPKAEVDAINLDTQIVVASKLLQAENTKLRAVPKRAEPPAPEPSTVTPKVKPVFNPNPSTLKVVAS